MLKWVIVIAALVGLVTSAGAQQTPPPDRVILVHKDDPEMNAARAQAQQSLGEFWKHFILPGANESKFALKIAISDQSGMVEHFWCNEIVGGSSGATCRIDNEPKDVRVVKMGERIPVNPALISDWMYLRDGKIQGGESIRVLLPQMTPEEAAAYRELLGEPVDEPLDQPAG